MKHLKKSISISQLALRILTMGINTYWKDLNCTILSLSESK